MKILNMALAAFTCLSILASAVPDSVVTGPYNVTFDLDIPKEAYKVEIAEPKTEESMPDDINTEYQIDLTKKTGLFNRAEINIISYETEQVIPTQDDFMKLIEAIIASDFNDTRVSRQKIDGYDGAFASGTLNVSGINVVVYIGEYMPSSTTLVLIKTIYPWEEGAQQLLNTIHVEKTNTTS